MPTMTEPMHYTLSSIRPVILDNYAVISTADINTCFHTSKQGVCR